MPDTISVPSAVASRLRVSDLAPGAVQSEIRAMSTACELMGGINLAQGVCDTPVPAPVEQEAIAAIRAGHNIYTRMDGIARLRDAISAKQTSATTASTTTPKPRSWWLAALPLDCTPPLWRC